MYGWSRSMAAVGLATVALAVCTAGFDAVAHANPPCKKWSFNGYTELRSDHGRKLFFNTSDSAMHGDAEEVLPPNGLLVKGHLDGGWYNDRFGMEFNRGVYPSPVIVTGDGKALYVEDFDGGVDADGFAYGTQVERYLLIDGGAEVWNAYLGSWKSAAPLKCADVDVPPPVDDVLRYDGEVKPDDPNSPFK